MRNWYCTRIFTEIFFFYELDYRSTAFTENFMICQERTHFLGNNKVFPAIRIFQFDVRFVYNAVQILVQAIEQESKKLVSIVLKIANELVRLSCYRRLKRRIFYLRKHIYEKPSFKYTSIYRGLLYKQTSQNYNKQVSKMSFLVNTKIGCRVNRLQ